MEKSLHDSCKIDVVGTRAKQGCEQDTLDKNSRMWVAWKIEITYRQRFMSIFTILKKKNDILKVTYPSFAFKKYTDNKDGWSSLSWKSDKDK